MKKSVAVISSPEFGEIRSVVVDGEFVCRKRRLRRFRDK